MIELEFAESDHDKFMTAQKVAEKYMAKWRAAKAVLADREQELLELKGPCATCRLHYAHSGPCAPQEADRA